ncbi:MAG: c-type cytochrome [Acidobacteria bacterium]|nr:c-type cytochrome [Acidobacteriota bacterium]
MAPQSRSGLPGRLFVLAGSLSLSACAKDDGASLWRLKCASCHGATGRGDTKFSAGRPYSNLLDDSFRHGGSFEEMRTLVAKGDPKSPMPAFEGRLTAAEIDLVVRYVEELRRKGRPEGAP